MAKLKIYDIRPPKKISKKIVKPEKKNQKHILKKLFFALVVLLLVFWIAREFIYAKKTTIFIWPKTEKISFQVFLSASPQKEEIDLISHSIPLTFLEEDFTISQTFLASSKEIAKKAQGIIRVYNKYHLPVTLVAKTRFQSSTQPPRVFLAKRKFTIPANGYVDVEVEAAEPGEEYNIDPSSFSVPGLRKYSATLYYKVYGKSFSKMKGGRTEKIFQITQDDAKKAENQIISELENNLLLKIEKKAGEKYHLIAKTLTTEIEKSSIVDAKIGDERKEFLYQVEGRAKIGAVSQEVLLEFLKKYIESKLPPDKTFNSQKLIIKKIQSDVDVEGKITVDVEFEVEVYSKIDKYALQEIAKLQRAEKIKKYIYDFYPELKKEPRVKFQPFFAKKASKTSAQIEIILKFD